MVFVVITFAWARIKSMEWWWENRHFCVLSPSEPKKRRNTFYTNSTQKRKRFLRMQRNGTNRQVCSVFSVQCSHICTEKKPAISSVFSLSFHSMNSTLDLFLWNLIAHFVHIFVLTETDFFSLLFVVCVFGLDHFVFVSFKISGLNN